MSSTLDGRASVGLIPLTSLPVRLASRCDFCARDKACEFTVRVATTFPAASLTSYGSSPEYEIDSGALPVSSAIFGRASSRLAAARSAELLM